MRFIVPTFATAVFTRRGLPSRRPITMTSMDDILGPNSLKKVVGSAFTAEELQACKIGGCCGKNTPRMSADQVQTRLGAIPLWKLSDDGTAIYREFTTKNWGAAMAFFNTLSELAEEEGHHPDFHLTNWRNVRIDLSTHAIGGLSIPDFVIAAKLDNIPITYSPKWLKNSEAGRANAV